MPIISIYFYSRRLLMPDMPLLPNGIDLSGHRDHIKSNTYVFSLQLLKEKS